MNLEAKKKLLRKIPSGLYVIGAKDGERLHAFTGSWLSQISMKPPMIVLGVQATSHSLAMMKKSKVVSVNYIRKSNQATIQHFFKPVVHQEGRLGNFAYYIAKTGAPILDEAIGYLECRVERVVEGFGDHAAVIAEVIEAEIREDLEPIVMSDTPWHYGG